MDTIQEFGIELDELSVLLQQWMGRAEQDNQSLQSRLNGLKAGIPDLASVANAYGQALAASDEATDRLRQACEGLNQRAAEQFAGVQKELRQAEHARQQGADAGLGQLDADRQQCIHFVRQTHEAVQSVAGADKGLTGQFTQANQVLQNQQRDLSGNAGALSKALIGAAGEWERGVPVAWKLFKGYDQFLLDWKTKSLSSASKSVQELVSSQLGPGRSQALSKVQEQSKVSLLNLQKATAQSCSQHAGEIGKAFQKSDGSCQPARNALLGHFDGNTHALLNQVAEAQQGAHSFYDGGFKNAYHCGQKFGELRGKYEALRKAVHSS